MMRILVATDFSTRSDRALRRAVLTAANYKAALTLVHVVDDDQPELFVERQRATARELLDQTAKTLIEVDNVETDIVIATGDPFDGILRTAEEIEPDLIIVGPHRRQLLDVFVGTTAERTIRRTRWPVLMANAHPAGQYRRTLVAVDFDEASKSVLKAAQRFEFIEQSELVTLHLFDAPAVGQMKRAMEVPEVVGHYVAAEQEDAKIAFQRFLSTEGLLKSRQLLKLNDGAPAAVILASSEDLGADLIVMGTNQRKGLEGFLVRSVAQDLLLDAKLDVLIVPVTSEIAAI